METLFNKLNGLAAAVASASASTTSQSRLQSRMTTQEAVTGSGRSCPTCPHQESKCSSYQNYLPARDGQVRTARASVQFRRTSAGAMNGIVSSRLLMWALCWTVIVQRVAVHLMAESSSLSHPSLQPSPQSDCCTLDFETHVGNCSVGKSHPRWKRSKKLFMSVAFYGWFSLFSAPFSPGETTSVVCRGWHASARSVSNLQLWSSLLRTVALAHRAIAHVQRLARPLLADDKRVQQACSFQEQGLEDPESVVCWHIA